LTKIELKLFNIIVTLVQRDHLKIYDRVESK